PHNDNTNDSFRVKPCRRCLVRVVDSTGFDRSIVMAFLDGTCRGSSPSGAIWVFVEVVAECRKFRSVDGWLLGLRRQSRTSAEPAGCLALGAVKSLAARVASVPVWETSGLSEPTFPLGCRLVALSCQTATRERRTAGHE